MYFRPGCLVSGSVSEYSDVWAIAENLVMAFKGVIENEGKRDSGNKGNAGHYHSRG